MQNKYNYSAIHFDSVDSTSTYARTHAGELALPAVISANMQTAGRGRTGKSFYSPADTGLYFSLLTYAPKNVTLITPAAGVAVCKAVEELTPVKPRIKWVNDVFAGGKKICGILTEKFKDRDCEYLCIGIGVNITTVDFPKELINAGSIGKIVDKKLLMKRILFNIFDIFDNSTDIEIQKFYSDKMILNNKKISYTFNGEKRLGICRGIDENCSLVVADSEGGLVKLKSGEVEIAE